MKTLYLAWQDPQTRAWHTVGKLTHDNDVYHFVYTQGALASPRFQCLGRMRDFSKAYYARELFPLFANRVLNRSRPEYQNYVRWLALDNAETTADAMQLLARSGGERATDQLTVYPDPIIDINGQATLFFLSHGLRYLEPEQLACVNQLQLGMPVKLRQEPDNQADNFAVLLEEGQKQIKLGYCPRYLARDLSQLMEKVSIQVTVERLNLDAPLQLRLLCRATFKVSTDSTLFAGEEYQLLATSMAA